MLFSSMIFLWIFLPLLFITYYIVDKKFKNIILLIASLFFYAWGEPRYIFLMLFSIAMNYVFGIIVENQEKLKIRKILVILCVLFNLGLLAYFKYFNFLVGNINALFGSSPISFKDIILPIGISFYTFQALSYVIDVYRSKNTGGALKAQKNILNLALYITFFPQLIAGPIVKYHDVELQIYNRTHSIERTAYGIKRFIFGISKKVLISNTLAAVADQIFVIEPNEMTTLVAWVGIICYTLQIYFDFSGYSDMAIGLGHMFGFEFMENFNYPYISKSIQEFWTRWHISLSTWFKEYLYIPLGGNRKGLLRTYLNLMIVFFCTGLWHGSSWNFIVWGLFHGAFMVLERKWLGKYLQRNPYKVINHIYTLLVVMIGWVFFRSENISYAFSYLKQLFIPDTNSFYTVFEFLNIEIIFILIVGIILSGMIQQVFPSIKKWIWSAKEISYPQIIVLALLLFSCIVLLANDTYNPFIYFRF